MIIANKACERFYRTLPTGKHQTGDIWINVPTMGLLEEPNVSALLITPSCDLQNNKSETLSFIPILSLERALRLPRFIHRFANEFKSEVCRACPQLSAIWDPQDSTFPVLARGTLSDVTIPKAQASTIKRFLDFLTFIECKSNCHSDCFQFLAPKSRDLLLRDLIRNSLYPDMHFLPKEDWDSSIKAIPRHSVGLFRYVLTYPMSIFDDALLSSGTNWKSRVHGFGEFHAKLFENSYPVRAITLQQEFLVDLLTRFTSLFNRIGSDDFTDACITSFLTERICGNSIPGDQ